MRTAIKTYQTAGEVQYDDQGRPFMPPPVTPEVTQERPQQPSSGAAGQTTPAAPPPAAIQTGPTLVRTVPPEPLTDPDQDFPVWQNREAKYFDDPDTAIVRSHRGDNRPLASEISRDQYAIEYHKDYPDYAEGVELVKKFASTNPKLAEKWAKQLDKKYTRMAHDQEIRFRDLHEKAKGANAAELKTIDVRPLNPDQEDKLNANNIQTSLGTYDQATFGPKNPAITTPQARHDADEQKAASPLTTLSADKLSNAIRNVVYLNRDKVGVDDAVRLVMKLGSPVKPGAPAANGLRGKAAANFDLYGVDAIGNRFVRLEGTPGKPDGQVIRINKDVYDMLSKARSQGYDSVLKFRSKLQEQRDEESKPGLIGRGLKAIGIQ